MDRSSSGLRVAVIGADSAGPLEQVVKTLPERSGFAVVVLCKSENTADTLRATSSFPIVEVHGRTRIEADRLFVVPSNCDAAFQRDDLVVGPGSEPRAPIDRLLRSLAEEHGAQG